MTLLSMGPLDGTLIWFKAASLAQALQSHWVYALSEAAIARDVTAMDSNLQYRKYLPSPNRK
jgi:hypothetical protein